MNFSEAEHNAALKAVLLDSQIEAELNPVFRVDAKSPFRGGPMAWILAQSAQEAADALVVLLNTPITPDTIPHLQEMQFKAGLHKTLVRWLRNATEAGKEAYHKLNKDEQEEIARLEVERDEIMRMDNT